MDQKKVREAIKLMEQEKKDMVLLHGTSPLIEKTDKTFIDLFNVAIEALEKQLPKKLLEYHYEEPGEMPYVKYGCGNGCRMQLSRSSKYCNQCGQRIDWTE